MRPSILGQEPHRPLQRIVQAKSSAVRPVRRLAFGENRIRATVIHCSARSATRPWSTTSKPAGPTHATDRTTCVWVRGTAPCRDLVIERKPQ